MAKKYFVFIPWSRKEAATKDFSNVGGPLLGTANKWVSARPLKFTQEGIVCRGGFGSEDPENFPVDINVDSSETTIYILGGHCTPGADYLIFNRKKIEAGQIAQRITLAGLKGSFKGKIKIYSCNSGTDGSELSINTVSFAEKVATMLREDEDDPFLYATFFGYRGLVTMDYKPLHVDESKLESVRYRDEMEKHAIEVNRGKTAKLFTVGDGMSTRYGGRASANRVIV